MKKDLLRRAVSLNKKRKYRKGWKTLVRTLALGVVFCTTYVLILPAITMQEDTACGIEAHVHTDACYSQPQTQFLGCGNPADAIVVHRHNELCRNEAGELVCPLVETVVHAHDDSCYAVTETSACPTHVHSDACAKTESVLVCAIPESEGHAHSESCTGTQTVLICATEVHTHADGCFEEQTLVCEIPEAEGHAHGESCFAVTEIPCTEPTAEGHIHDDTCQLLPRGLTCALKEIQLHSHAEDCFDVEGALTCTQPVVVEHNHTESCTVIPEGAEPALSCTLEEHIHTSDCYPLEEEVVIGPQYHCGYSAHGHTEACYHNDGTMSCTIPEHVHEATCVADDVDLTADVEQPWQWDEDFGEAALAETRAEALLAVAEAQLGYRESTRNVILVDGLLKGYTRYGAKFGTPYADWNTLFANFCVSYAGVDEEFPVDTDAVEWYLELEKQELLQTGEPQPGDLLFFGLDRRGEPDGELEVTAVGILKERREELLSREVRLKTIQGDIADTVDYVTVEESEGILLGYAVLPEPEEEGLDLTCTLAEHIHGEICYDAQGTQICSEAEHIHSDGCHEEVPVEQVPQAPEDAMYLTCALAEHTHGDTCRNPETSDVICGASEHAHGESCYAKAENIPMMETPLTCTVEEHTHEESCFDAEGVQHCTVGEHSHTWSCHAPAEASFTYEDDRVTMEVKVVSAKGLPKGLTMEILTLDPADQDYISYEDYAQENASGELFGLSGYRVCFYYGGQELPLPDAEVTAELTVKPMEYQKPEAAAADPEEGMTLFSRMAPMMAMLLSDEEDEPEAEENKEPDLLLVTLLQGNGSEVTSGGTASFGTEGAENSRMTLSLGAGRTFALTREAVVNPEFTVEFYAEIPVYQYSTTAPSDKVSLPIIDTRGNGDGTGGSLPKNVGNQSATGTDKGILYLHLEETGRTTTENPYGSSTLYTVHTDMDLREIYSADTVRYEPGMTLEHINKLYENTNYQLKQVNVSQDGGSSWTTYTKDEFAALAFTNSTAAENGYLTITGDTVIRLEYNTTGGSYNNAANVFDYDITTTNIYRTVAANGTSYSTVDSARGNDSDRLIYQRTSSNGTGVGINSAWLDNKNVKFAFGNSNTNVPYESNTFAADGYANTLNQFNAYGYKGCTFGIVTGYNYAQDRLIFANGISHQALFNDEAYYHTSNVAGKTSYYRNALNFVRTGDTYVLSGINSSGAINGVRDTDLNYFFSPQQYGHIYTNNFWPVDGTVSDEAGGHDMLFGHKDDDYRKATNGSGTEGFPESDDGTYHNSYFGMQFAVEFTLDGQYCGPLEYLFYGDDDMWVFLTDMSTGVSTKICDIGGVHSSVGSFTDLWDYIPKGTKGTYVLSVFYTERGASGSSCYIEFTLPQVVSIPQNTPTTGSVTVGKEAVDEVDPNAEYSFRFELAAGQTSAGLTDNYSYTITNSSATRSGTIKSGDTFTIKAQEKFTVSGIPEGLQYTFTEILTGGLTESYNIQWSDGTLGASLTDTVERSKTHTFTCTNYAAGSLSVTKVLVGESADQEFVMEVTLTDGAGNPLEGTYGSHVVSGGKLAFSIKPGEVETITNLPVGTIWSVQEQDADGFMVRYNVNGTAASGIPTGSIVHKTTVQVEVVNEAGYRLPDTGGTGTSFFTFGGLLMMAAACVYCVNNFARKRQRGGANKR